MRATITEVLGRMGPLVVEPLIEALNEEDRALRQAAARVLGQTSDERAAFPLRSMLRRRRLPLRFAAARNPR